MPRPRPDLVPRPQLAERLDRGLARGLVLVCAPAGYGKTVLLADWARRGQQPVAWLSLDVGDNDPARFWRHGVAALDQVRPGLAGRVGPLLGPPAPSSYEGLVTALINELAAGPDADQTLLVLDDYHLIDSEAVHTSLGFLIEHRPPGLRLVLASRSDPPLTLARLRGRGQLAELRAAELRFTADEAAALLRQGAAESGVALPETAVAALAARTEGWAAGLQLAALSLRGQPDAAGFTAAFTGSHRYVLDYLTEEVLEQQSDQVRTFLLETSVLERLSGELCDAVTGRPGSQALLAQALLAFYSSRTETEEPLLDAAEQAYASTAGEPFEPTVGRAGSMLVNVPALIAIRRGLLAQLRGDAEDTAAFASRALAESKEGEWLLSSTARRSLAVAEWLRGRLTEAEHAFAASIAGWQAAGQPTLTVWHRYQLGQVQRALGCLDAAIQTYEQALSAAAVPGRPPAPTVGLVYVGLAEVAYQRNELDSALRYVTEGIALERQFLPGTSPVAGLVLLAWIRQAVGDPAGALEAIGEAGHGSPTTAGVLNPAPAQRARLLLAQGDVAAVARWTQETGLHAEDEPRYPREPGYLVLARVLLAQQRPAEALALLDRLHAAAVTQHRVGSVIEAGALRALALAARGQDTAAVNALADVLTLACPQGYVRVFADEGPPMAALLTRLIAAQRSGQAPAGVPLGCLARLQRAFDVGFTRPGPRSGTAPAAVPGLVEQLTSRELEVLEMLAAGSSNQAIADQLVVTLDTVKKHVSHVLGKLGAANRTEAVTRARELSLIP